jgi:hypothetical protein
VHDEAKEVGENVSEKEDLVRNLLFQSIRQSPLHLNAPVRVERVVVPEYAVLLAAIYSPVPQFFSVNSVLVLPCSSFHASLHVQLAVADKALPVVPEAKSRYLLVAAARQ